MLTRKLVRIALVAMAMAALQTASAQAAAYFFSEFGGGTACALQQPCTLNQAIVKANSDHADELACTDSSDNGSSTAITKSMTIDCSGTTGSVFALNVNGSGITVTLKNLTVWGNSATITLSNGTLILDNVHLTGNGTYAVNATPSSASNLVVRNSIIDDNSAGALLKPQAGGSLSARFDHVTIASNLGGGIKIDTTNGPVTGDVTDCEISSNVGNGMNAVGGAGGPAMFNIHNSVIAKNSTAGVQVNGSTAAAMIDTTLLDSNASGATTVINGGHILTYGNNRIVGSSGSGFTGTASLQ
jgi:hypothetical protein